MDIETLEKVIAILKTERNNLAMASSGCYDAINAEADKEDVDALFEAVMTLRENEIEQFAIRRVCYRLEKILSDIKKGEGQ